MAPEPDLRSWPANIERQEPDWESRLTEIVSTIQEFAELKFKARAPVGPDGDIVDAIAAGVNFLGEELEASFGEIERRIVDRTAELALAMQDSNRRAFHDALTDLPNRALFWDRVSHRLALASRSQARFALLYLDIDNFKAVNDTFGHAAGDQLLVDTASRLRAILRTGDTAARIGGDEFAVLLDDIAGEDTAMAIAQRIIEALGAPYEIEKEQRITIASLGVAVGPNGFENADAIVAAADAAMYDAKRNGGRRCVLYREDLHRPSDRRDPGV